MSLQKYISKCFSYSFWNSFTISDFILKHSVHFKDAFVWWVLWGTALAFAWCFPVSLAAFIEEIFLPPILNPVIIVKDLCAGLVLGSLWEIQAPARSVIHSPGIIPEYPEPKACERNTPWILILGQWKNLFISEPRAKRRHFAPRIWAY